MRNVVEDDDYPYEDDEYEEEDVTDSYIKKDLPIPGEEFCESPIFEVIGSLTGDIKWNNMDAQIKWKIPYFKHEKNKHDNYVERSGGCVYYPFNYNVKITSFTSNCGAKAISSLGGPTEYMKLFINYLESFLYYKCNCGVIVGSDFFVSNEYHGGTGSNITKFGTGYTKTDLVWNPNYTTPNSNKHNIFLFYKYLNKDELVNY